MLTEKQVQEFEKALGSQEYQNLLQAVTAAGLIPIVRIVYETVYVYQSASRTGYLKNGSPLCIYVSLNYAQDKNPFLFQLYSRPAELEDFNKKDLIPFDGIGECLVEYDLYPMEHSPAYQSSIARFQSQPPLAKFGKGTDHNSILDFYTYVLDDFTKDTPRLKKLCLKNVR